MVSMDMLQDLKVPYARRADGSVTTPAWEAAIPRAKRCTYSCLECAEPLTLRAADSEFKVAHFAHRPDSVYREGHDPESLLHLAAKARAMEALRSASALMAQWPCATPTCAQYVEVTLALPPHDDVQAEVPLKGTPYRLDIALKWSGDIVFALEARQTHAVDELKAQALDRSVPWIEFDAQEMAERGVWRVLAGRHPDLPQHDWRCGACMAQGGTEPELLPTRQELLAAGSWNDPGVRQAVRARLVAVHGRDPDLQCHSLETISHILDHLRDFPVLGTHHHIMFGANAFFSPSDGRPLLQAMDALCKAGILVWVTSFPERYGFHGLPVDPRDCPGL